MCPIFLCASLMDIFPDAVFAVSLVFIDLSVAILYSPSLFGMVAMV